MSISHTDGLLIKCFTVYLQLPWCCFLNNYNVGLMSLAAKSTFPVASYN